MLRIAIPLVLAGVTLSATVLPRSQAGGLIIESGVTMKTRDGVPLVADLYRPAAEGRFPVLLQRTPYDRRGDVQEACDLASAGYVVIKQDVRGRFDSGGEFYPFQHEANDGYDAVEWAASAAVLQRSSRHVGRLLCRGDADAGLMGHPPTWSPFFPTSRRLNTTKAGPTSTAR